MNIENIREYCLNKRNATEDFPFDESTLAFRVEHRIFAIIDLEDTQWFCLKCDPQYATELREKHEAIKPAWHMNKKYWNQLDYKNMEDRLICRLIDHSYEEVLRKLSHKIRKEYGIQND